MVFSCHPSQPSPMYLQVPPITDSLCGGKYKLWSLSLCNFLQYQYTNSGTSILWRNMSPFSTTRLSQLQIWH
jgi:hypothetical protein